MLKWNCNLCLSVILLSGVLSVHANTGKTITIAVDASGSMRGFFKTHGLQEYVADLQAAIGKSAACSTLFFLEKEITPYSDSISVFGQSTYLDAAFENIMKSGAAIAILITDNFQDSKMESESTLKFYDQLMHHDVCRLNVMPKQLPFSGRIYNSVYNNVNVKNYSGMRGLLTYILLLDSLYAGQYDRVLACFSREEILLIKPITRDEINIIGVPDDELNRIPAAIDAMKKKCPGVQTPKKEKPNARITGNGIIEPLAPQAPIQFQWEQRNRIHFFFLFVSKMPHINIGRPDDLCDNNVTLTVGNLAIKTDVPEIRYNRNITGKIIPPGLVGMLESNHRSSFCYRADIIFGPCTIDWGLDNVWSIARWDWSRFWFKPYHLTISFDIALEVPGKYFSLTEKYREKYFTISPDDFERIYSPEDIVTYINVKPMKIGLTVNSR